MRRSIILLFTALLVISGVVSAKSKNGSRLTVPSLSMPAEQLDVAAYEKKYEDYDGVYLRKEYLLEHTSGEGGSFWSYYEISKQKHMVLNPDSEALTTFKLGINKAIDISTIYLRITYPNMEVKQYGYDDLHKEKTSENQVTYKFVYPNVTRGTIIEEGYQLTYNVMKIDPPLIHSIDLQFPIPCEKYRFSYTFPSWWTIQTKKVSDNQIVDFNVTEEGNKSKISYSAQDIPAYIEESYAPSLLEGGKCFEFQVLQMQLGPSKLTGHLSWDQAVDDFVEFATKKGERLSSKMIFTANDLIKGIEEPVERMDTIITYLQENKELSPDLKGDDLYLTVLAKAMLNKAGIDAKYLFLHSAEQGYFDETYISSTQISSPALGVKLDNKTYVLFPYIKIPVGYIPEPFQGQKAVAINMDKGGAYTSEFSTEIWDVPVEVETNNRVEKSTDLTIDQEGFINVADEIMFYGNPAIKFRELFKNLREDEQKKTVEKLLAYDEGIAELTTFKTENLAEFKKPLKIILEYKLDNLVTLLPDEIIFQTGGLFSPSSGATFKIDSKKRYNPIKIPYDEKVIKNIIIHFPDSWTPTTPLKDVSFSNRFGEIDGKYSVEKGKITVTQHRSLKKSKAPKEIIEELDEIAGPQSRLFIPSIVFKNE
jgi:hypothetical protein